MQTGQAAFSFVHLGQFADRHAVAGYERVDTDKAFETRLQGRPLQLHPAQRIRPI